MKKLGDETYEYGKADIRRTIWYADEDTGGMFDGLFGEMNEFGLRMVTPGDHATLVGTMKDIVDADMQTGEQYHATETQWVFYSTIVGGDAIGDEVRFSIYLRLKGETCTCNINMSDFVFASSLDAVLDLKNQIEGRFND